MIGLMQMEKTMKHYIVAKDGKIVSAGTIHQPEDRGFVSYEVTEEQCKHYREYVIEDGKLVHSKDKEVEVKSEKVRAVRNSYLVKYVDPKQLFLVWNSLTDAEKADYTSYRTYLLDYTKQPEWYEHSPKTLEEWKLEHSRLVTKTM